MKTLSRKRVTDILTESIIRHYVNKGNSVYQEVGIKSGGNLRADVLTMNMKGKITIVEVKSCWQDFATDNKWHNYLEFCHQFYFCIPFFLFNSEKGAFIKEVCAQHKIGLLVVGNGNNDYFNITKSEDGTGWKTTQNVWVYSERGCKNTTMDGALRKWLITKLAWRGGISKATLGNTGASVPVTEEYGFDRPLTESQFLSLDELEQKRYMKAFPKTGFKNVLRSPENAMHKQRAKNKRFRRRR